MLQRFAALPQRPSSAEQLESDLEALEQQAQGAAQDYRGTILVRAAERCVQAEDDRRALAYYGRAIDAYLEFGYFDVAATLCRKVISLYPHVVRTRCTLAFLSLGQGLPHLPYKNLLEDARREIGGYVLAARAAGMESLAVERLCLMAGVTDNAPIRALIADRLLELGAPQQAKQVFESISAVVFDADSPSIDDQRERWAQALRQSIVSPPSPEPGREVATPQEPSPALLLERVTKCYEGRTAVDDLSLTVPAGTIYAIVGPNGAGKTSTIRMAMSIIAHDAGRIRLLGADPERDCRVLRRVGYLPEEFGLYNKMTVMEVIVFFARFKGMAAGAAGRAAERWTERMELGEWADARVETLSRGLQGRVRFITTVVHDPELLILDEPTSALDPGGQKVLRETVLEMRRRGRTVLFGTHDVDQAEQLCEHVCVLAGGRKVLEGRLRDIKRVAAGNRYHIEFAGPSRHIESLMVEHRWFHHVQQRGSGWEVQLAPDVEVGELLRAFGAIDVPLIRYHPVEPSLREILARRVSASSTPQHHPELVHA